MRQMTMTRFALTAPLLLLACQLPGGTVGSTSLALGDDGGGQFENPAPEIYDPFAVTDPVPAVGSRLHSCQKIPYDTLGAMLVSRGVNLGAVAANGQPPTAGQIYKTNPNPATLGAPNYLARLREVTQQTTSGATKLMDIFVQAAPEIIAAMPNLAACKIGGASVTMFDKNDATACTREGVMCLLGSPPSKAQVDLCTAMVKDNASLPLGQRLAVAAILASAHGCE